MKQNKIIFFLLLFLSCFINNYPLFAQKDIKINGHSFNKLDKKNRKQGNWIFYDSSHNIRLTTYFEDDNIVTPLIFYENSDTAFVRFHRKDNIETFIYYYHDIPITGSFVYSNDSTFLIEIEPAYVNNKEVTDRVIQYKQVTIPPIYMFGQEKLSDYLSAAFFSSNFVFNKPIYVILYLSASGKVTKAEFPGNKNTLHVNEENELTRIYSGMPRWQPFFSGNVTKESRIIISDKHIITDF